MRNLRAIILLLLLPLVGCQTAPPFAPIELSDPGWTLRQGQALWRPARGRPELAGELLVALHRDGRQLIQFTKTPFPFVTARREGGFWWIEFPGQARPINGPGESPARFVWFEIPKIVTGEPMRAGWHLERLDNARWRIENSRTGETLEGFLSP